MRNSGIKNITHGEDGKPWTNMTVKGRVSLGENPDENKQGNYPTKVNHFIIRMKEVMDRDIEWVKNSKIMKLYNDDAEPTELPVTLVSDNIDEVLFSQLQYWRKDQSGNGFRYCYGDGEEAMRWDDEKQRHVKFADPDDSTVDGECPCPYYTEESKCKSRGHLYFQLLYPDREQQVDIGGLFAYQTSSAKIIRKLQGSIKTIKEMLAPPGEPWQNASIKGVRLKMKVDQFKHRFRDNNDELRTGMVSYPYLTLPMEGIEGEPRREIREKYDTSKNRSQTKRLSLDADNPDVDDKPSNGLSDNDDDDHTNDSGESSTEGGFEDEFDDLDDDFDDDIDDDTDDETDDNDDDDEDGNDDDLDDIDDEMDDEDEWDELDDLLE